MSADDGVFTLGHSPDPDDAFMFYAIAKNKIDLRGYRFEHRLEDIQTLNERALRGELHISAISIHAYAYVADKYALLPCGASMGDGYGPIVVRKRSTRVRPGWATARRALNAQRSTLNEERKCSTAEAKEFLRDKKIAVPGTMTSAFLALRLFMGKFDYVVVPFDQIFEAVKSGSADGGLIIHEGQLTYERAGFEKLVDLGEWWKQETGLPLPLGGNVIRKDIPRPIQQDLVQILRESVDFALTHRTQAVTHSLPYARDMTEELAGKFIGMYVNEFTRDYGQTGRAAIRRFLGDAARAGYIDNPIELEFADELPRITRTAPTG
jgi:1,4-dihydroxy-6-naphthoate synthase